MGNFVRDKKEVEKPLRVCKSCGLEAWTTQDLEKFSEYKPSKHGRRNVCKSCYNKQAIEWRKKRRGKTHNE